MPSTSENTTSTFTKKDYRSPLTAALMMNAGQDKSSQPNFPVLSDILQKDDLKDRSLHSILGEALDALNEEDLILESNADHFLPLFPTQ
mmetsp:Transcript_13297/g.18839  ORF Transcript_13297/g.18839 Transcript_13297/m.18839 type:complete len:89 (+) Transcript_13297:26-292(+)